MHAGAKNEGEKKAAVCWRLMNLAQGKEAYLIPQVTRTARGWILMEKKQIHQQKAIYFYC